MASAAVMPSQRHTPPPIMTDRHRLSAHSIVSSSAASSFQTAPLTASSPVPTSTTNVIHSIQRISQDVPCVRVTDETITVERSTMPDSYFTRYTLPPSPPASIDDQSPVQEEPVADEYFVEEPLAEEPVAEESLQQDRVLFAEPTERPDLTQPQLHRASTDTRASIRTVTISSPVSPSSFPQASSSRSAATPDIFLQPHAGPAPRPMRRNTTGSAGKQHTAVSTALPTTGELESDIQLHAENIRRERISKRAKLQQEAEAALTREKSVDKEKDSDEPIVGKWIKEDHVNYVLMYNMLTGIRIGVSRCQAKIKRPLTPDDFQAQHKYSFDIIGNELTPSAKYDFKFKDYAPFVFRSLREDLFHLDPADYLLSLTAKYILSELGSPGKSGSFFYFSRDYRYIIKTIHRSEHAFLLRILPAYYEHIKANPHTLISRFYGLHRVKLPRGRKIHFVIMNNIFPPHRDIHETYDLKGSTVGREYPEEKAEKNPRAVLKDLNWINRGKVLELGPEKNAYLMVQLERDAEFLKKIHVMDYSLLVGIHNMRRGNRDNVRRNTLKVFSPNLPTPHRRKALSHNSPATKTGSPEAIAMRRAIYRSSDSKRLDNIQLPDDHAQQGSLFRDRQQLWFYQDEGGLRATDDSNEAMDTIYYLGVIDILTPYGLFKKVEHVFKGLQADIHKISPVPPAEYADRFIGFMKAIVRGGEGGARFKSE